MNRRVVPYIIVGIVSYLIFIVATVPATLLAMALQRASNGMLVLQALSGTAWSGRGELVLNRGHAGVHSLGQGRWSINPLWLFAGSIKAHVDFRGDESQIAGSVRLAWNEVTFINTKAHLPGRLIQTFYAPATFIAPGGMFDVTSTNLSVANSDIQGTATVLWRNAETSLSSVKPIGDYRIVVLGQGVVAKVKLETERGALSLIGDGQWQRSTRRLDFKGEARALSNQDQLDPLLRLLGKDQGDGRRSLTINIAIP